MSNFGEQKLSSSSEVVVWAGSPRENIQRPTFREASEAPSAQPGQKFCKTAAEEEDVLNSIYLCRATNSPDPVALLQVESTRHTLIYSTAVQSLEHQATIAESAQTIYIAFKSTIDLQSLVTSGNVIPTFRYGACVHSGFWRRAGPAVEWVKQNATVKAKEQGKKICITGYSTGGSIAQLVGLELLYAELPVTLREELENRDMKNRHEHMKHGVGQRNLSQGTLPRSVWSSNPVTFQGDGAADPDLHKVFDIEPIGVLDVVVLLRGARFLSIINEGDCIPGMLNISNSSALLSNSFDKLAAIGTATKLLGRQILPNTWHRAVYSNRGRVGATAYLHRNLLGLQSVFQKFGEGLNKIAPNYCPFGLYCFLSEGYIGSWTTDDYERVEKAIYMPEKGLIGGNIVRHFLSSYTESVAGRLVRAGVSEQMNFYERLKLPSTASDRQIRKAYKKVALQWHPDRWSKSPQRDREYAETCFKLAAEAYETLADPKARAEYNRKLKEGKGFVHEFVREGTIGGMTLDKAVALFAEVVEAFSAAAPSESLTTANTTVLSQTGRLGIASRGASHTGAGTLSNSAFSPGNHENMFAPNKMQIVRQHGTEQKILYVDADELLPGDLSLAKTSDSTGGAGRGGFSSLAVVGGAVAVGAGLSLAISAWTNISHASKKRTHAETVRSMPNEQLSMLLLDSGSYSRQQRREDAKYLLDKSDRQASNTMENSMITKREFSGDHEAHRRGRWGRSASFQMSKVSEGSHLDESSRALATVEAQEEQQDLEAVEEFHDCIANLEAAELEAHAEEEFYECLDLEAHVDSLLNSSIDHSLATTTGVEQQSCDDNVTLNWSANGETDEINEEGLTNYDPNKDEISPHDTMGLVKVGQGLQEHQLVSSTTELILNDSFPPEEDAGSVNVILEDAFDVNQIVEDSFKTPKQRVLERHHSVSTLLPEQATVLTLFGYGSVVKIEERSFDRNVIVVRLGAPTNPPTKTSNITESRGKGIVDQTLGQLAGEKGQTPGSRTLITFDNSPIAYLQPAEVIPAGSQIAAIASSRVVTKRRELVNSILTRYRLDGQQIATDGFKDTMRNTAASAVDSGIKATGGVLIAKTAARVSTRLAGAATAPLATAAVIVDIGREYWSYRSRWMEKHVKGILSTADEKLLMSEFRHKAGHHVVTGVSAAAGAYAATSSVSLWAGAGVVAGPVGMAAMTGMAIIGGIAGYFVGSTYYDSVRNEHFVSLKKAQEEIEQLQLGARVLFDEHDTESTGNISVKDFKNIIQRITKSQKSEMQNEELFQTLEVLKDKNDDALISWDAFWGWVSEQALQRVTELEAAAEEATAEKVKQAKSDFSRWATSLSTRMRRTNKGGTNDRIPDSNTHTFSSKRTMYASVYKILGFRPSVQGTVNTLSSSPSHDGFDIPSSGSDPMAEENAALSIVQKAQIDELVECRSILFSEAEKLKEMLTSADEVERNIASVTIAKLLASLEINTSV